jgi:hypothetical protein
MADSSDNASGGSGGAVEDQTNTTNAGAVKRQVVALSPVQENGSGVNGVKGSYQSALTHTATAVKASACAFYGYRIYNPNSAVVYVQLFNLASASVTVGTTAPTDVIPVPAGGFTDMRYPVPDAYVAALTVAATTTVNGSTAPGSALVATFFYN